MRAYNPDGTEVWGPLDNDELYRRIKLEEDRWNAELILKRLRTDLRRIHNLTGDILKGERADELDTIAIAVCRYADSVLNTALYQRDLYERALRYEAEAAAEA